MTSRILRCLWDVEHPTTRLHELLADAMYQSVLHCEPVQGAQRSQPVPVLVERSLTSWNQMSDDGVGRRSGVDASSRDFTARSPTSP